MKLKRSIASSRTLTPRVSALHAALFAFPMLFAAAPAGAVQYSVTKLGPFDGTYIDARSLNAAGQVVGEVNSRAFLWQSGSMQDLGTLGGTYSSATGINAAGEVVGSSTTRVGAPFDSPPQRAYLRQSGIMQDLGTLGGAWSNAYAINDAGQVVGQASTSVTYYDGPSRNPPPTKSHAFLWQKGSKQDLGTLGGNHSTARGINAAGQVVGWANTSANVDHAFLWQSGSMQDLGTFGGTFSYAYDINDAGQVVGVAKTSANISRAFLWQSGSMQDLGTLGGSFSSANAINAAGQVVGSSATSGGFSSVFLWQSGSMVDLNSLIDPMAGVRISSAIDINDSGQILARGCSTTFNITNCNPVLLTPVPEPETYLMMLAGLGLLAAKVRRRNSTQ